jgi:hypothetical protein
MSVQFTDNSARVKATLDDACIAYLYEMAGEVEAQTKRNVPPGGDYYSQQKNSWSYVVDESKGEAVVGNPLESSLWTEFGTGDFALNGDGRKGYWVYVKDGSTGARSTNSKSYTLAEAKRIVAMMRADGLDAHYTHGQPPKRPFFKAFQSLKPLFKKRAEEVLKGRMK